MIRVFIVDDEAPARTRLRKLLEPFADVGRLEVAGEAKDGVEAVEWLSANPADVVFLDIRMPGLDGFEVLERLAPDRRPIVVFTTAYDEYAIRAFDSNAVDYLLKPFGKERLEEAIARVERLRGSASSIRDREDRLARLLDWFDAQAESKHAVPSGGYVQHLSIPYRDRILVTPVEQIVSAEITEGITRLNVVDDTPVPSGPPRPRIRQHIVGHTLDQLAAMLDPEQFMRVHRSAIVQFNHIRELIPWFSGRYKLILTGNHEVIASRERSKVLKEKLNL
jgi:two-component system LytT family response regulator